MAYIEEVLSVHWSFEGIELWQIQLEPWITLDLFEDLSSCQLSKMRNSNHPDLRILEHLELTSELSVKVTFFLPMVISRIKSIVHSW